MAIYGAAAAHRLQMSHVVTMHGSETGATPSGDGGWRCARPSPRAGRWSPSRGRRMTPMVKSLGLPPGIGAARSRTEYSTPPGEPTRRAPGTADCPADDQLVLAVGNLVPCKGHIHLLRALSRINGDAGRALACGDCRCGGRGNPAARIRPAARHRRAGAPPRAPERHSRPARGERRLCHAVAAGGAADGTARGDVRRETGDRVTGGRHSRGRWWRDAMGCWPDPGDEVQLQQALEQLLGR